MRYSLVFLLFVVIAFQRSTAQIPTKCLEIENVLADACNNACPGAEEGTNEMFRFIVGPAPIPLNQLTAQWATPNGFLGWIQNGVTADLTAMLNGTITNCGWLIEPPGGIIPAGKRVLGITSTDICITGNSFALLADTLYVIYQVAGNTLGHFKNTSNIGALSSFPTSGSSYRTFVLSVPACSDTVAYNIAQMVNIFGTYGGSYTENDGSSIAASWPGAPSVSYFNNGCQAPITPFGTAITTPPTQVLCGGGLELDAVTTGSFSTSYWSGGQGEFDPPNGISTTYTMAPNESGNVALSFCIVGLCGDTVCGTYQLEVITLAPPVINVDPAPVSCGASAALSATVQGTNNFFWNGGMGVFSSPTALSTNYTPGSTESGTIDLQFCAIGGCSDTVCTPFQLQVDGPPIIEITANGPTTFCESTELILTATGGSTYSWNTGSTSSTINVNSEDTFVVTATNACGQSTDSISTLVTPLPTANVTGPATTCPNSGVTLIASGGATYAWNTSAVGDTIDVEGPGTYTVTVSDQCGSDEATIIVAQGTSLAPTFSVDITAGCSPLCVVFSTVPAPNTTYTWVFGDGTTADGISPTHCFQAGGHDVTLTSTEADNANGCPGSIIMPELIHAWPVPEARFSASPAAVTIEDPLVQFIDESTNADSWIWNFGTVLDSSSTLRSPAFAFDSVACYTITLDVTSTHGCTDNAELELCVEDGYALWVPNAFTPNGDDINDVFMVQSSIRTPKVFQLTIYNRWGEAIFTGGSLTDVWDGANAPNDVYVWKIKIIDTEGYPHEHTGHVILVR